VTGADPALEEGWVDRELALEFPELRLVSVTAPAPGRRTPSALRERLALLADRFHGARALTLRREPVPAAYRVFFRHVGIDPDAQRTPVEAAALDRLIQGGFVSRGPLDDALLVAVVETGVPVWAVDDARLDGPLGLRGARAGERLGEGEYAADLVHGRVVVADATGPVAVLFGDIASGRRPDRHSARLRLFAVAVPGVPALHVEEALFGCAEALSEARGEQ
jgi:DNA/RNA-binding domain of Phe-tRNA-synthetase-like protein